MHPVRLAGGVSADPAAAGEIQLNRDRLAADLIELFGQQVYHVLVIAGDLADRYRGDRRARRNSPDARTVIASTGSVA